jgi:hypothetical protein
VAQGRNRPDPADIVFTESQRREEAERRIEACRDDECAVRWQASNEKLEGCSMIVNTTGQVTGDHRELVEIGVKRDSRHAGSCVAPTTLPGLQ